MMKRRKCINCEYHLNKSNYGRGKCYFNIPTTFQYESGTFPTVDDDDFCSYWEPKWNDNELIKQAWQEFIMVHKLITSGENND